ncbi:MAG: hypothetical protein ACKOX6_12100 [Bdellovibrio sp.]
MKKYVENTVAVLAVISMFYCGKVYADREIWNKEQDRAGKLNRVQSDLQSCLGYGDRVATEAETLECIKRRIKIGPKIEFKGYSNNQLHSWAASVLDKAQYSNYGYYDQCLTIAEKVKVDASEKDAKRLNEYGGIPLGLPLDQSEDLINACAIMLIGAEW